MALFAQLGTGTMILQGSSIIVQNHGKCTTAARAISALLIYNSVKYTRAVKSSSTMVRHNRNQETSLSMYISLLNIACYN